MSETLATECDEELDDYWDDEEDEGPLPELWECFEGPPDEEDCDQEELEEWLEGLICRRVWHLFHQQPAIRSERVSTAERTAPGYAEKSEWVRAQPEVDMPRGDSWWDLCSAVQSMFAPAAEELYKRLTEQVEDLRDEGYRVFVSVHRIAGNVRPDRFLGTDTLCLDVALDATIRVVERDALDRLLGDPVVRTVDQDPFGQYVAYEDDYD